MPADIPEGPLPMVLLRHTTPDGASHFDWVLGRCPLEEAIRSPDTRDAITFRLNARPDYHTAGLGPTPGPEGRPNPLDAQRLPDHRRLYLWFEGELSAGRGRVERLASGVWWGSLATNPPDDAETERFLARFDGERQPTHWHLMQGAIVRGEA